MGDTGVSSLLYALESQYVDTCHKQFKNSILDGPKQIGKVIKALEDEIAAIKDRKPPALSSRHAKVL